MDAGRAVGRGWPWLLGVPELAEKSEDGGDALGVVVVSMGEDDVRDVGLRGVMVPRGIRKGFLEVRDVFFSTFASVYQDVGVAFPQEIGICPYRTC